MKIYLESVGCRLNQAEIESYASQFRLAGHILVATPEEADLALVNTCAVTAAAVSDSRQKVRQVARRGSSQVVVTGCWATLQPKEAAALPSVRHVIPNLDKDRLVPALLDLPEENFDLQPLERQPIPGARLRTRAFIKVQDGCDNRCTFCVTALARGPGRSRPLPRILAEIQRLGEAQEIVLTGVHLGSWGKDFIPPLHLRQLVQAALSETDIPRLRLSSLEPWDLDEQFFELWQDARLCRQLHLPLQSGSAATLRRMSRKTTPQSFAALVASARLAIPDIAITTDLIAGFPGESAREFEETLDFVKQVRFAGGHVFPYSARPGTAAARMAGQIPPPLRKERASLLRQVLADSSKAYQAGFVGQVLPVLWEADTRLDSPGWRVSGLSGNALRVKAHTAHQRWNHIDLVRLEKLEDSTFHGVILSEPVAGRH